MYQYVKVKLTDLPPLLRLVDSLKELADWLEITPQALYVRRKKGQPIVTAEEAARLLTERDVPLHISRPDLFPKLRRG